MRDISILFNPDARKSVAKADTGFLSRPVVSDIRKLYYLFKQYEITPLHKLESLAGELGVSRIWVKDESKRFGLNAFKVLGSAYAILKHVSGLLGSNEEELTLEKIKNEIASGTGGLTFVTATDGNHGRGVAWVARQLGQKAVIYMPRGSAVSRVENIRKEGAEVIVTDFNYDDSVRLARDNAEKHRWILVQDTAWEGYYDIPLHIIQGYAVILDEILEQLEALEEKPFTHVFLQAGVGSFAASIAGSLASVYGEARPAIVIVEPHNAACIYQSAAAQDGKPRFVTGDLQTIMAGLACGEPCTIAWDILRDYADAYIACPDYAAARGMRILGNPAGNDPRITSGESGAVGVGLLSILLQDQAYTDFIGQLGINKDSRILFISTEGDTDPANYRRVVWDGACPST